MKGRVVRKVEDKGFGFIKATDGKDYFFHKSAVQREPGFSFQDIEAHQTEGTEVEFEPTEGEKGPRAVDVTRA